MDSWNTFSFPFGAFQTAKISGVMLAVGFRDRKLFSFHPEVSAVKKLLTADGARELVDACDELGSTALEKVCTQQGGQWGCSRGH